MENPKTQKAIIKEEPRKAQPPTLTLEINKQKASIIAGVIILLALGFYFKGVFIAATVNGSPISRLSIIRELEKQAGKQVLDSLITKKLVEGEISKKTIVVSDDEINQEIKKVEDQVIQKGGTLEVALAQEGMTAQEFKGQTMIQIKLKKFLADKTIVSEEEVAMYVKSNKIVLPKGKEVETENQVREQLKQQKFNQVTQEWIANLKAAAKIKYYVNY